MSKDDSVVVTQADRTCLFEVDLALQRGRIDGTDVSADRAINKGRAIVARHRIASTTEREAALQAQVERLRAQLAERDAALISCRERAIGARNFLAIKEPSHADRHLSDLIGVCDKAAPEAIAAHDSHIMHWFAMEGDEDAIEAGAYRKEGGE